MLIVLKPLGNFRHGYKMRLSSLQRTQPGTLSAFDEERKHWWMQEKDTHLRNVRPASLLPPRTFWKAIICEILPLKWWRIFYAKTRTIDRGRPATFLGHSGQTIKNWSILSGDKIFSDTVLNCFDKLDNDLRLSAIIIRLMHCCQSVAGLALWRPTAVCWAFLSPTLLHPRHPPLVPHIHPQPPCPSSNGK